MNHAAALIEALAEVDTQVTYEYLPYEQMRATAQRNWDEVVARFYAKLQQQEEE